MAKWKIVLIIGALIVLIVATKVGSITGAQDSLKADRVRANKSAIEQNIRDIVKQVDTDGIIESVERDEGLDGLIDDTGEIGYRVATSSSKNICVYVKNNEVIAVRYADNYLYRNGNILKTVNEVNEEYEDQNL